MADLALRADGIGKRYRLGRVTSGFSALRRAARRRDAQPSSFWALRDVSFELEVGNALGIIGRNGAGKSTLLKVLSRITEPTTGYVDVAGRVGALLEVGTGFHPELTGRENVYLNGAILGMRKSEIAAQFDRIVEFADVARHIDTPVKWYSSGMYVRLAFAVAAHLEPEVLIVDEVLAVGDVQFQKRCLDRMAEVTREGRTILFVSHNMQVMRRLCNSAIWLEAGEVVAQGEADVVARRYLTSVDSPELGRRRWPVDRRPGDDLCRVVEMRVSDDTGEVATSFLNSRPIDVTIEFDLERTDPALSVGFDIITTDGVLVFHSLHRDPPDALVPTVRAGRNALRARVPAGLLNNGRYLLNLRVALQGVRRIAWDESVLHFDVFADHGESLFFQAQGRPGVIAPVLDWAAVPPSVASDDDLGGPTSGEPAVNGRDSNEAAVGRGRGGR